MAKLTKEQFIESLKEMTLVEINDVIKAIETEFGVSAAAPVAAAAGPVAAASSEVSVIMTNAGDKKIEVIKLYKEISGLGLMEAKAGVEKAPLTVKANIKPEEAAELKKRFEAAGATVEVK
ncbi:50S ribosomal protein L7/L12 [[Mycoplasma] testudinis]|uniref:50S ribosomal protein L7/L12 n=1 Tax=[Mycoplasma] testudinis TaxID=33924 RepID=UPI0004801235|nr:50S ribosomal protein L7/L12 [[Mycoplasma] testudinis]